MRLGRGTARVLARVLRLTPPATRRVRLTRDLPLRARDGVALVTDHYAPDLPDAPTVLVRTPYGRGGPMRLLGWLVAERGFHVVVQSCRGTHGSGGTFEPLVHERTDGLDALDWLRRQRWYDGRLGMFGVSYQGFVQWAVAAGAGPDLRAMVAVATASTTRDSTYSGESFALDTVLTWAELIRAQGSHWLVRQIALRRGNPRLAAGLAHFPLFEADRIATGRSIPFFQEWLRHHAPQAEYWRSRVFDAHVTHTPADVCMVTGWHDIFLPAQLRDYAALRAAGRRPRLTIGPWHHGSPGLFAAAFTEGLPFLRSRLTDEAAVQAGGRGGTAVPGLAGGPVDAAVRVHVGGAGGGWRDLPDWPPPARPTPWYLHPAGGLSPRPPVPSAPDQLRYDPADPTPSFGGPLLLGDRAGRVDNRPVERRADVLCYSSDRLTGVVELVGPVTAQMYVRGELPHLDVFVRLCDVDRRGRSWNVCDGLVRVDAERFPRAADGSVRVTVELWPVAHRFVPGHRIRVQLAGGAHPRYARNPGTGEPLDVAVTLRVVSREILHDPDHPSAVFLPMGPPGPSRIPVSSTDRANLS